MGFIKPLFLFLLANCLRSQLVDPYISMTVDEAINEAVAEAFVMSTKIVEEKQSLYLYGTVLHRSEQMLTFSSLKFTFYYMNGPLCIEYMAQVDVDLVKWVPNIVNFVWYTSMEALFEFANIDIWTALFLIIFF